MSNHQDIRSLKLLKPISIKIVERKETRIGDLTETTVQIEVLGANNVKYVSDQLIRSVETDDRIDQVITILVRKFASKDDSIPVESEVMTTIANTTKGEIEGDFRWAKIESTFITAGGTRKSASRQIKLPLKSACARPLEQGVAEEIFNKVMDMKF